MFQVRGSIKCKEFKKDVNPNMLVKGVFNNQQHKLCEIRLRDMCLARQTYITVHCLCSYLVRILETVGKIPPVVAVTHLNLQVWLRTNEP